MYLFGGDRPWDASQFTASDDRVRGGRSQSYLTVPPGHPASGTSGSAAQAEFSGHLDITALGGAGFASQRTVDEFPPLDLSDCDALVLDVASGDGKKYTVTLKDEVLPRRPDGRDQSTVSWEYDFVAGLDPAKVVIPFRDFQPTYRGRPKPDAQPLDLSSVKRVSFMMRSFFGEQEGDFSIVLKSVSGETSSKLQAGSSSSLTASGLGSKGYGLTSWIGRFLGWSK